MNMDKIVSRLRGLFVASLVVCSFAFAGAASAQSVPIFCGARPAQAAKYNAGLSAGQQRADNFFASTEVMKNKARLAAKVGRALDKLHLHLREAMEQDVGAGRRCRIQGVADGFLGRLAQLLGQCVIDGGTWGQFAADLYCELSIELGGLAESNGFIRAPAGLCGTLFEQTCDDVYSYVASEGAARISPAVKSFLASRSVVVSSYPGCGEYTEGAFEAAFESARELDCAYGAP